jgi:hypothetical protein
MANKNTVAMFTQTASGERVQVGWASPKDESGVRTFEYLPSFQSQPRPTNVSFEDDELTQLVAEEQANARLGDGSDGPEFQIEEHPADDGVLPLPEVPLTPLNTVRNADLEKDAEPIEDAPDPEDADDLTNADVEEEPIELDNGGEILDTYDDDEEDD